MNLLANSSIALFLAVERADVVVWKNGPRRDIKPVTPMSATVSNTSDDGPAYAGKSAAFKVQRVTSCSGAVLVEPVDDGRQPSWFESRSAQPSITASAGTTERGLGMSTCDQWTRWAGMGLIAISWNE